MKIAIPLAILLLTTACQTVTPPSALPPAGMGSQLAADDAALRQALLGTWLDTRDYQDLGSHELATRYGFFDDGTLVRLGPVESVTHQGRYTIIGTTLTLELPGESPLTGTIRHDPAKQELQIGTLKLRRARNQAPLPRPNQPARPDVDGTSGGTAPSPAAR